MCITLYGVQSLRIQSSIHLLFLISSHFVFSCILEDSSFWLPLYGNLCCRLVAQPLCMTQNVMCGKLRIRVCKKLFIFVIKYKLALFSDSLFIQLSYIFVPKSETNPEEWRDVYGVLNGSDLKCYQQKDDTDSLETPVFSIPINKVRIINASVVVAFFCQQRALFMSKLSLTAKHVLQSCVAHVFKSSVTAY